MFEVNEEERLELIKLAETLTANFDLTEALELIETLKN